MVLSVKFGCLDSRSLAIVVHHLINNYPLRSRVIIFELEDLGSARGWFRRVRNAFLLLRNFSSFVAAPVAPICSDTGWDAVC